MNPRYVAPLAASGELLEKRARPTKCDRRVLFSGDDDDSIGYCIVVWYVCIRGLCTEVLFSFFGAMVEQ